MIIMVVDTRGSRIKNCRSMKLDQWPAPTGEIRRPLVSPLIVIEANFFFQSCRRSLDFFSYQTRLTGFLYFFRLALGADDPSQWTLFLLLSLVLLYENHYC